MTNNSDCNLTRYEKQLMKKKEIKDKIAFQLNCLTDCIDHKWAWYISSLESKRQ